MAKFSVKAKGTKTINQAGGKAYKQSDKLELVSILLTSFLQDKFYESGKDNLNRLVEVVNGLPDKKFAAQAALYARNEFGMRSVSHVVAGEIAKTVKGETWTKNFFEKIVHRPDDMMEILAYLYTTGLLTEPNALKKGFAKAVAKFSSYQLAKYRYEGKAVSLVDIVNLVHPAHSETIAKLIKGELKSTDTWEAKLSATKGDATKKEEAWRDLLLEKKIGYFALLRNLRNIIEQAPDLIPAAAQLLVDPEKIKKSLVLPFRFVTALKEVKSRELIVALNKALDIYVSNVPKFPGRTLIALDCSGSMVGKPAEIGSLFASILYKTNESDLMIFSDRAAYMTPNPMDSTLTIAKSIGFASGGTNFHAIFQSAVRAYDRIVILSDMQGWVGYDTPVRAFNEYKARYNTNPFIYSFDLQGLGNMQFPENNVACITGWSEKIFDVMALVEQDKQALIHKIESIEI